MSEIPPTPAPASQRRRSSAPPRSDRRRSWLLAGLLALALVALPILVFLLIPTKRGGIAPRSAPSARATKAEPRPPEEPTLEKPRPKPAPSPILTATPSDGKEITGTVTDEDGHPLEKATVVCQDHDGDPTGLTDADGHYHITADAAGCTAVAFHPPSLPSQKTVLVAGRANDFRLLNAGGIEGIIVDERGAPVDNSSVAIETWVPASEGLMGPTGRTLKLEDHTGTFRFEKLSPGKYSLTASGPGRPIARSEMIVVEASRITRGVRITLLAAARLSGHVVDGETRKPVAGAAIALDTMTGTSAAVTPSARTDETGFYGLEVPPTGPFSIRIEHGQYRTKLVSGLVARNGLLTADVEVNPRGDAGDSPELTGVGAILAPRPRGGIAIVSLVADAPASKAGVREGDLLLKIDGSPVEAMSVPDCVQRLRGPEGTRVTITIQHGEETRDVAITRAKVSR